MKVIKDHKYILVLFAIAVLSAFLRFYKLSEIPSGFYVDEAAIGYNAYSIVQTGADEYGKRWPIFLRSYNAYSSPLYMYITTIPVKLMGLSIYSTRFASAVSGVISTVLIFFILNKIDIIKSKSNVIIGTLVFAISPWSIFFSRGAFEANVAFMLLCAGFLTILYAPKDKRYIILAAIILSLSSYAYQAMRLTGTLLITISVLWTYRSKKVSDYINPTVILAVFAFISIQIPQLLIIKEPAFASRAEGLFYSNLIDDQSQKIPLSKELSLPLSFAREFFAQYSSYLSPYNLFFNPDSDFQRSIPELSVFYQWLVIPFVYGIYSLFAKIKEEQSIIILSLLSVSIMPVALTKDPFSTLRSISLLLPLIVVITLGFDWLGNRIKNNKLYFSTIAIAVLLSLLQLWRSYFVLQPSLYAKHWDYGYERLADEIAKRPDTHFLIDESRNNPSYIKLAFFLKTKPETIQGLTSASIKNNYYGGQEFHSHYQFDNMEISTINWEKDIFKEQIIVGDSLAISPDQTSEHFLERQFEILDPLRNIVFVGYKTNPKAKCEFIGGDNPNCDI